MRRIKKATVKRLALCKRGKNGLTTLFKSDESFELATLVKGDPEKGELLAVMFPKYLADEDGDFVDSDEAIKSMTASLIKSAGALDIEHDGKDLTQEQAYISEVFTIQKSDKRFAGWKDYDDKPVDVTGGCAVKIQIDDPALRDSFRSGDWDGVSLFGPAVVEQVDIKAASKRVAARMRGVQEIDMTKEELQAALAKQKEELTALVKSTVESALSEKKKDGGGHTGDKPEDKKEEIVAPTFTGDPMDDVAMGEYETAMRRFELVKAVASGDITADKIAEMRKALTATTPSDEEAGIEKDDDKEVRALKVKLHKAQKSSNVRAAADKPDADAELRKANEDFGLELGKSLNEKMGNAASTTGMKVVSA